MCKKLAVLALVLGMASVSFADMFGNWETAGNLDGWTVRTSPAGINALQVSTGDVGGVFIGNTVGNGAVQVWGGGSGSSPYGGGVRFIGISMINGAAGRASLDAGQVQITVDATMFASNDPGYGVNWAMTGNILPCVVGVQTANAPTGDGLQYETAVGGNWNWNPSQGTMTKSLTFNITNITHAVASGWATIFIMGQTYSTSGVTSIGAFHYDNVQVNITPEPATMSLLGLGGLALLRRKR